MEIKIPKEVVDFMKAHGNAIFPEYETYGYYRTPWMLMDQGTDVVQCFWGTGDIPSELIDREIEDAIWLLKMFSNSEKVKELERTGQLKINFDEN